MLGVTRLLTLAATVLCVSGALYPTYPISNTVWKGGRVECITWIDDGSPPRLQDTGRLDVELYVNSHTHVATLAKNVAPESKFHQFKVLPSWGPDAHTYHVRLVSQTPPRTFYTADFTIEDMAYNSTSAFDKHLKAHPANASHASEDANKTKADGVKSTSTTSVSLYTPVMTLVLPDTTIVSTLAPTTPRPSPPPSQFAAAANPAPTSPSIVYQPDPNSNDAGVESVHDGTTASTGRKSSGSAGAGSSRRVDMEKVKFRIVFILWPVLIGVSMAL